VKRVYLFQTHIPSHEAGWAGLVWRAGSVCRDLGTSVERTKINFEITWKTLSPGTWAPTTTMLGSQLEGLKMYQVIGIAGPTLSRH